MKKTTIIEPIYFAYMFCTSVKIPLIQQLVYRKVCLQHFNATFCEELYLSKNKTVLHEQNLLQKEASQFGIYDNVVRLFPAILATTMFAMLFNSIGRKKVLAFPILGGILLSTNLAINAHFMSWPVEYLLIGSFIDGMFGQSLAVLATVNAYVADVTSQADRVKRTTILESMQVVSALVAKLGSGVLLEKYGFFATFILIFAMYAFQVVYWFFLKESLVPSEEDKRLTICDMLRRKLFLQPFRVAFKKRESGKRKMLLIMGSILFTIALVTTGVNATLTYYLIHPPFNLTPSQIGYYQTVLLGTKMIGVAFVTYVFLHKLKWTALQVLVIYCCSTIAYYVVLGLMNSSKFVYIAAAIGLGLGVGPGAIRGKLSKLVETDEQGSLFAFLAVVEVISTFVFGIIINEIYKLTVDSSPSDIIFSFAGIYLIPTAVVIWLLVKGDQRNDYKQMKERDEEEKEEIVETSNENEHQHSINT